ncbi:Crp/Fnr family transcriptional regulator [Sphingomonas sp.]|uniref:Crp/Fnr family transcriptional regulator n=1 Tax=Sphingomonas sp. TaxID=28214 RepID=UPI001B237012|nr:Crp/Fnr family transcriptional regulator [Sphingomonas sp.]MBO9713415.1 Crp/Fnr family transcriptional regulator [Sphingomonas sp.]
MGELVELTPGEVAALEKLEERPRHVRRGAILQRENENGNELFIMRKGLMMSYVLLDDGSRQILRFHFAGDLLGLSGAIYHESPESLCALSDCVVCPFDRSLLSDLMAEHPRLASLILVYSQIERVALTDRLAALGRTSAKQRIAALLLELRNRIRATDKSVEKVFALGLTQEEIGDATGLTSVHVNRMLRQLEEERLIAREGGRVTLLDERALARAANYVNRYQALDLGWLPGPS